MDADFQGTNPGESPVSFGQWLLREKDAQISHALFYWTAISLTYNSNHIEGSTLTASQTQAIFDGESFLPEASLPKQIVRVDDVVETRNHFRAFNHMLDTYQQPVSHEYLHTLHKILKSGTSQEDNPELWNVGGYKVRANQIGFFDPVHTAPPEHVSEEMENFFALSEDFTGSDGQFAQLHAMFESIHPFSDGNGRIGRLLMFKEALRVNVVPPIILDEYKPVYVDALQAYRQHDEKPLIEFIYSQRKEYRAVAERFITFGKDVEAGFTDKPDYSIINPWGSQPERV